MARPLRVEALGSDFYDSTMQVILNTGFEFPCSAQETIYGG